jgi:acetyltransferase
MKTGNIRNMFNPKAIALIGASDLDGSIGKAVLDNLINSSSDKTIFPVNPRSDMVQGLTCYPDVASLPSTVDLAIIATPASTVPEIVEGCGKSGVGGVVILSAGFREIGETGRKLEEEIAETRQKYGLPIVGPNSIGLIRPNTGLNASFLKAQPEKGNIAFISQSGAPGGAILDWAVKNHIGFSMFLSLGSMIDVDFGDLIDFLGDDYHTRSIMLYMKGVGDARKFMSAARGFARNKPIVVIKPGRFNENRKIALSHTGAMAGDDRVYDAALKRAGVIRVKEVSDLFNSASVLDSRHLPKGCRLAIVTNSGSFGVMATDVLMDLGGELAELSESTLKELDGSLPFYWSRSNPIDVMGDADTSRYEKAVFACLNDPAVDGLLVLYAPTTYLEPDVLAAAVAEAAKKTVKPVLAVWVGGDSVEKGKLILMEGDIPTYSTPEEAVKTYMYMYRYYRNLQLLYETPGELSLRVSPPKNHLKALLQKALREGRVLLSEEESKDFLSIYGIPSTTPYLARDTGEAVAIANRLGYPVVLKIVSPDISHKTDVGGTKTDIRSDQELEQEYASMLRTVYEKAPHATISGINVQKMVENADYELIIGAKKDIDFGTVILFGMGGIGTQAFRDVSIGLPPLNQTLARRLMEETAVYKLLLGYRGKPPADLKLLEQMLANFSNLIVDFPEIAEMDINPVLISGGRPCAADARIILDPNSEKSRLAYPHLVITPYPTRYVTPWRLSDGSDVLLRPIKPEDEPLELEMLSTLLTETMRTRFFSVIKDITHEMLVRFCNIDYDREVAVVAEVKDGDKRRIVGIGRLIIESDLKSGEYAVLVHDDFQGKGLGYKLMDVIIGIAQDKDLDAIFGIILKENDKMLRVVRKLGFTSQSVPGDADIVRVHLALK